MEEIQNTVFDNNKAPGPNGILIEFFKAFFSKSDLSTISHYLWTKESKDFG